MDGRTNKAGFIRAAGRSKKSFIYNHIVASIVNVQIKKQPFAVAL